MIGEFHRGDGNLEELQTAMVSIGSLVIENTKRAGAALLANSLDEAGAVIEADEEIDRRYVDLERQVYGAIEQRKPVGSDLRFLVASTRILYELERSGDLAVNCAKALVRQDGFDLSSRLQAVLRRLTTEAAALFGRAIEALAAMDAAAGPRMAREDDVVDDLVAEFYRINGQDSERMGLEMAIELSRIGRYLERIGDHAVNIAEHVTYIVTGEFPDHEEDAGI
jgi:phosphate transport system protein